VEDGHPIPAVVGVCEQQVFTDRHLWFFMTWIPVFWETAVQT